MKNNDINPLVLEYLEGGFDAEREKILKSALIKHGYKIDELEALRKTYQRLDDVPVPQASDGMTENFYRMLENYKRNMKDEQGFFDSLILWLSRPHIHRLLGRIAYSFVLLFIGWSIGFWLTPSERYEEQMNNMSSEIRQMKELIVLAELNQPSPNERIRTINQIKAYGTIDERTIAMLFNTLCRDSNTNVRLVAMEALVAHADRSSIRQGLIQSLTKQESPLVQLALTDVIVDLGAKQAIEPLRSMLERRDLNDVVRARIENSLTLLM